jgi:hypothetical protein
VEILVVAENNMMGLEEIIMESTIINPQNTLWLLKWVLLLLMEMQVFIAINVTMMLKMNK